MRLEDFYSVKAAAAKAGIPYMALHQRIHRGSVKVTRLSDTIILIHKDEVARLIPARPRNKLPWNKSDPTRDNHHPLYKTYHRMVKRCYLSRNREYINHGALGRTVCEKWLNSFEAFVKDVGFPPSESSKLELKDPQGNYEPNNCRWA